MKTIAGITLTLMIALCCQLRQGYSQPQTDESLIATVDSALFKLASMQIEIKGIHPFLQQLHPVAIVEGENLFIFDFDSSAQHYQFQKKEPVPFPMPAGIRASFPLSSYGGRPSCIVSKEIFASLNGYATIFHEFMHCGQSLSCENRLKDKLTIAKVAAEKKDYSWEINHAFPYEDSVFVASYADFLTAMQNNDAKEIKASRGRLKKQLSEVDYEYMVWEEWKEGFARFIENRIRDKYSLEKNHYGKEKPYNRVTFYFGGEQYIAHLAASETSKSLDVEKLFARMLE